MAEKFRVATYNICHGLNYENFNLGGKSRLKIDLRRTAESIASTGADIVALNEVYGKGPFKFNKQEKRLASAAGFKHASFGEAAVFGRLFVKLHYGNALLSKYTIISSKVIPVPSPEISERLPSENKLYEDRAVLVSGIDVNGTHITVIATHFGLNLKEQKLMVSTLESIISESKTPVILMGDFNSRPHTDILAPLYKHLKSAADECNNRDLTFSTYNPHTVLDHIFVSKDIKVCDFAVVKSKVSDHFPCVATVEV
ncbi:MAG: endonuclease/exonuclease/phosphatase family protein [Clostridia bacterium]|nr:endonuclease/exonuclease/phosphatase family protein [Clostridia bacterium]